MSLLQKKMPLESVQVYRNYVIKETKNCSMLQSSYTSVRGGKHTADLVNNKISAHTTET